MALAFARSKVVVPLLLINFLLSLSIIQRVLCQVLVCYAVLSVLSSVVIISLAKRELIALKCILTVVLTVILCLSLLHGARGWSAEFDCGVFWSYLPTFRG